MTVRQVVTVVSTILMVSVMQAVADKHDVHVVEDDGADETEQANFKHANLEKESKHVHVPVLDEGDDNDEDAVASLHQEKAIDSQVSMEHDEALSPELAAAAVKTSPELAANQTPEHDPFAVFDTMSTDDIDRMIANYTRPLRQQLIDRIEEHDNQLTEDSHEEPQMKIYDKVFGNSHYQKFEKRMDEERAKEKIEKEKPPNVTLQTSKLQTLRAKAATEAKTKEEAKKAEHAQTNEGKLVAEESSKQGHNKEGKTVPKASVAQDDDDDEYSFEQLNPMHEKTIVDNGHNKEKKVAAEPGKHGHNEERSVAEEPGKHGHNEEGESVPETSATQMHVDMKDGHDEEGEEELAPRSSKRSSGQIRTHHKDPKKPKHHGKQIRSAEVDAAGNIISAVENTAVRAAPGDDNSDDSRATGSTDVDSSQSKKDEEDQSPPATQDQLAAVKRLQYITMAGFAVGAVVIAWMLVRRRAQQMIDRAEAFDDASSVSSSTMTEENPTVKVNRALLERMATISQKLSEKVEEARTSSASESSSNYGRGYHREKKNPQDS